MPTRGGQKRVAIVGATPLATGVATGLTAIGCSVTTIEAPSGGEDDVRAAFAHAEFELGGIDQVVHAWVPASLLTDAVFVDIDEESWADGCERALEVAWWVARQSIPALRRRQGSLVFLVPTIGMAGGAGFAMLATYAEGVRVLAKGCGRQLGVDHVTANTIATAPHLWVAGDAAELLTRSITLSTPAFGRHGDAAGDIAQLVAMLATPNARFLTAATLTADGGTWMGL